MLNRSGDSGHPCLIPDFRGNELTLDHDFDLSWNPSSIDDYTLWSNLFICLFIYLLFIFGSTRVWTQGFTLARQVLYCLRHNSSSFCSGYSEDSISLCFCTGQPELQSSYCMLPTITGMTAIHHHAQIFFHWDGQSRTFCFGWPWTTVLFISGSQIARITGMSYWHQVHQFYY
jgi:hypothetical protein